MNTDLWQDGPQPLQYAQQWIVDKMDTFTKDSVAQEGRRKEDN